MGYENGKIYKLECEDGHYYYGCTINELRIRLRDHKNASKTTQYRVYKHINAIGWENVNIILIEAYPCENRRELNRKENEYISLHKHDPLCLNNNLAFLTNEQKVEYKTQHTERNKEALAEYHRRVRNGNPEVAGYQRQYRESHKEDLRKKKHEYYMLHKAESDAKGKEWYERNKEAILLKKRLKYAETKQSEAR